MVLSSFGIGWGLSLLIDIAFIAGFSYYYSTLSESRKKESYYLFALPVVWTLIDLVAMAKTRKNQGAYANNWESLSNILFDMAFLGFGIYRYVVHNEVYSLVASVFWLAADVYLRHKNKGGAGSFLAQLTGSLGGVGAGLGAEQLI